MNEIPKPINLETANEAVEKGLETPTFSKNDLGKVDSQSHMNTKVGFKRYGSHDTPDELVFAEIKINSRDFHNLWDSIKEALPEEGIDFATFKKVVAENVEFFLGEDKVTFPEDNKYLAYAIKCMVEDSLEPAKNAGDDVAEAVRKIFHYTPAQWE